VGRQGEQPNDITETRGYVWGAGLTTRKSALVELGEAGFRPMLTGRRGNALSAGEDSELCLALRKAGWRIWYEPRLKLRHFLPAGRLDWNYLRRLHRGFGASRVALNAYRVAWHLDEKPGTSRRSGSWVKEVRSTIVTLLKNHRRGLARFLFSQEGDDAILQVEDRLGFLLEMLIQRQGYDEAIQQRKDKTPVQRHGHPPSIASHTSWWVGTEKH